MQKHYDHVCLKKKDYRKGTEIIKRALIQAFKRLTPNPLTYFRTTDQPFNVFIL